MNTNHKLLKRATEPLRQFAAGLMVSAMLALNLAPLTVKAVDVQTLPDTVAAVSGFTHAARVTWDDLNAADASTVTLALSPIPTNCYVDRVGYYVEELFTNSTVANTNLTICIGVGGNTNRFFGTNYIDGGTPRLLSGASPQALSTNLLVPFLATTSTNYVTVTFSDGAAASVVDNYGVGKIRIYYRIVNLSRYRF